MTEKNAAALVERVLTDPDADPAETKLVIEVLLEEALIDGDVVERLLAIFDQPTRH